MKAVIMAAGQGTRMLPLTKSIPKVLVEINGKPFLYYVIKNLKKAGYDEFGIIVGYKKEKVEEFIKEYDIDATTIEQKDLLGTGDAVKQAKEFTNNENFIVLGGDNLWDIKDLKKFNKEDNLNYISGFKVDDPGKYGVLIMEDNNLVRIHEKPKEFVGDLISTGLYKFTPEVFDKLDKIEKSPRGEYELTDAITMLAEEKKVKVIQLESFWKDLGKIDDIPAMEKFLKEYDNEL